MAKCKIKLCCLGKTYDSCADCPEYESCPIVQEFYGKNGDKYGKYRQAAEYIRSKGYQEFLMIADGWKNAYGKYQ